MHLLFTVWVFRQLLTLDLTRATAIPGGALGCAIFPCKTVPSKAVALGTSWEVVQCRRIVRMEARIARGPPLHYAATRGTVLQLIAEML